MTQFKQFFLCLFLTAIAFAGVARADEALVAEGKKVFRLCQACHTAEADAKHRVGPNLFGVVGSKAGSKEGFRYSPAMSGSDVVWDEEALASYLENPRTFIRGNRMSFAGLRKPEQREAIIAYLKTLTAAE